MKRRIVQQDGSIKEVEVPDAMPVARVAEEVLVVKNPVAPKPKAKVKAKVIAKPKVSHHAPPHTHLKKKK